MSIFKAIRQYRLLSLRLAPYHFNPGIFSASVTVFFLYVMVSLGFWQLDRAEYKDTLQQKIEQRKNLSALNMDELPESKDDRRYLPITFSGEYDARHSFLLDNITLKGRVGYHVFTPVKSTDSRVILVYRGFVGIGESRQKLPDLKTPEGRVLIHGLLDLPPSRTILLAEDSQQTERWPVVLQYIDLAMISQLLGYPLYDMVLLLDQDSPGIFAYDIPVLNLNAAKNNGYAFQWFAMSIALLIIFFVVNIKKDDLNNE
ncbi:MAG: SURF1 family protein [Gammaproteobacteria bacterium]|nr:SURF1 family protein [Gammaproteobacteria bacterium]